MCTSILNVYSGRYICNSEDKIIMVIMGAASPKLKYDVGAPTDWVRRNANVMMLTRKVQKSKWQVLTPEGVL